MFVLDYLGRLIWEFKTKGEVRGSAIVTDLNNDKKPVVIFGSTDRNLYVLDRQGKPVWYFRAEAGYTPWQSRSQSKLVT